MKQGKIIVLSAPSGTGKSTIINKLMEIPELNLAFSISATCRMPRGKEQNGVEYYFLSEKQFQEYVKQGRFVEWEEVYPGCCYGTLISEVERITDSGHNLIMDIDVKGALNIKRRYGKDAMSVFIEPPSLSVLEQRLRSRGTDDADTVSRRLAKAEYELSFASSFDHRVVNDTLTEAVKHIETLICDFTADK